MHKAQAFFITGTDTEVGKTFVTAALLRAFAQQHGKVVGMKPIAAGTTLVDGVLQNEDVTILRAASSYKAEQKVVCPYLLKIPAAPHIAAQLDNIELRSQPIRSALQTLRELADVVLVEGVGGFDVPLRCTLGDNYSTADLSADLALPVILVVGLKLGCLNHAVLTTQAVAARGLPLAGWVANTLDAQMPYLQENIATLKQLIPAPCLGVVPNLIEGNLSARLETAALCLEIEQLSPQRH